MKKALVPKKGKYAWMVKVGEKGQFVIPKEAREVFEIHPGDNLIVFADEKKGIAIPPKSVMAKYTEMIFGESDDEKSEEE